MEYPARDIALMPQSIRFEFQGGEHELVVPDGGIYGWCATEIIEGRAYPFPKHDTGPPVRSVVDLGAHAGEFTLLASLRWPDAIVHAYEPNPVVLPLLKHNCQGDRFVIHEQAVGEKAGWGKLYFSSVGSVAATIVKPHKIAPSGHDFSGVDVEIVDAKAIVAHKPDVLKLDMEGPEGIVLAAMGEAVADIHRIYVEFHHENIRLHIEKVLKPTHSLCYSRIEQANQGEVMYVRRERHATITG